MTVNKMEGAPLPSLGCWTGTKQMGEGREQLPLPLPPPTPAPRGPARQAPSSLALSLPGGWSCLPPLPARLIRGRAGFMYY